MGFLRLRITTSDAVAAGIVWGLLKTPRGPRGGGVFPLGKITRCAQTSFSRRKDTPAPRLARLGAGFLLKGSAFGLALFSFQVEGEGQGQDQQAVGEHQQYGVLGVAGPVGEQAAGHGDDEGDGIAD